MPQNKNAETVIAGAEEGNLDLDQAIRAAMAQHSGNPEQAGGGGEAIETPAGDDTKAKPVQQTQESEEVPGASLEGTGDQDQLLDDADFERLKNDPAKLRRELQKRFTQKTQALAEQRKKFENYQSFIESLERDLIGTLRIVAEQSGHKLVKADEVPASAPTQRQVKTSVEVLKKYLGTEYEGLAEVLAPAIEEIADMKTAQRVKPLEQSTQETTRKLAQEAMGREVEAFAKTHADFEQVRPKMNEIAKSLLPGPGMTPQKWLETLYKLATVDRPVAQVTKEVVAKINKTPANSEQQNSGANPQDVVSTADQITSLRQAFDLALKGKVVE